MFFFFFPQSKVLEEPFYGPLPFGGHTINVDDATTNIEGVEFFQMGQVKYNVFVYLADHK
jgi:hypothetical protein